MIHACRATAVAPSRLRVMSPLYLAALGVAVSLSAIVPVAFGFSVATVSIPA